jgi:hypothetical protein
MFRVSSLEFLSIPRHIFKSLTHSSILQVVKLVTDSAMLVMFVYEFRKLKNLLLTYMKQGQAANKSKTGNLET